VDRPYTPLIERTGQGENCERGKAKDEGPDRNSDIRRAEAGSKAMQYNRVPKGEEIKKKKGTQKIKKTKKSPTSTKSNGSDGAKKISALAAGS